jgi:hypothetical protein
LLWLDEPPPQANMDASSISIAGEAATANRRRRIARNTPAARNALSQKIDCDPPGQRVWKLIALVAAVVATTTWTEDDLPLVRLAEFGSVQVAAGVTMGVILQLRFTEPLKPETGARERLNVAFWPALIVWELGDPDAVAIVKLLVAPVPDSDTVCGLPVALSVTLRVPVNVPLVVGVNVTEIWQELFARRDVPQLLVSEKSPLVETFETFNVASPVFASVTIWGELVVLTCCAAKVSEPGVRLAAGTSAPDPVPERLITWGLPGALSVIVTVPRRCPVPVGLKVTMSSQLVAGARDAPQLLVCEKSPVVWMLSMLSVPALLSFTSSSAAAWLEVPWWVEGIGTAFGRARTGPVAVVILRAKEGKDES